MRTEMRQSLVFADFVLRYSETDLQVNDLHKA